jgi:hypothetical protein
MDATPEELALNLSRASVATQRQVETQLRERATALLATASIVVPVSAVVVGHGPGLVAIPFGIAAVAYALCVRECGMALLPRGGYKGLLGSELLETIRGLGADIGRMQETAARYLDGEYRQNQEDLATMVGRVRRAIALLTSEVAALVVALLITLAY